MMCDLKKVAVVTGGNKGIGFVISNELAKNNYHVIACGRTNFQEKPASGNVHFFKGDLTNYKSHKDLVNFAVENFGRLDLYVNNVGISSWKPINLIDEGFLDEIIKTNLYSAFWGCKASSERLEKNGSIVNISSIAGKRGSKNNSAYVATKFAMNGLTQSLAKELGEKQIRVNAICPVLIKTEGLLSALSQEYAPGYSDVEKFITDFCSTQSALNKLPTAEEVSQMVIFLASEKASAITGQCINVDCGVFPQ